MFLKKAEQTLLTELLAFGTIRFGHTIGKKNHAIAGSELRRAEAESLIRKYAQHAAAFRQPLVGAVAVLEDRRIVSRAGIAQAPRWAVELGIKQSDKTVARHIAAEQGVEPRA